MRKFLLRRFAFLIPQLFVVSFLAFLLIKLLPGDPVLIILGPLRTQEGVIRETKRLGLDKPFFVQYGRYVERTVQGDFGNSIVTKQPVIEELGRRVPATLWLITLGLVACVVIGIGVGYVAALAPPTGWGTWLNKSIIGYGFLAGALPDFWVGLILVFIFFATLGVLPAPIGQLPGYVPSQIPTGPTNIDLLDTLIKGDFGQAGTAFRASIMPVVTLAIVYAPVVLKITAVTTTEVFNSQYVTGARAVGVRRRTITRYIMRNALLPIVTTSGVLYAFLLGGAVLVETVFSWGGFGQYTVDAVNALDFNVIQGMMLVAAVFTIIVYLLIDIIHYFVDPRIRVSTVGSS